MKVNRVEKSEDCRHCRRAPETSHCEHPSGPKHGRCYGPDHADCPLEDTDSWYTASQAKELLEDYSSRLTEMLKPVLEDTAKHMELQSTVIEVLEKALEDSKVLGEDELKRRLEEWIAENFNPRCGDYEVGCPTCEAWVAFDSLFNLENLEWDHQNMRWRPKEEIMGEKVEGVCMHCKGPLYESKFEGFVYCPNCDLAFPNPDEEDG